MVKYQNNGKTVKLNTNYKFDPFKPRRLVNYKIHKIKKKKRYYL